LGDSSGNPDQGSGGLDTKRARPSYHRRQERVYQLLAPYYDRFVQGHTREITAIGVSLLSDVRDKTILDVGTGTGNLAFALTDAGACVTAVDLSPALIRVARGKPGADSICFAVMDAAELAFGPGSFDYACAAMMLHEIPDPYRTRALAEMVRVCRSGVLIIDFRRGQDLHWTTRLVETLEMSAYRSYLDYALAAKLDMLGCPVVTERTCGQFTATLALRTANTLT